VTQSAPHILLVDDDEGIREALGELLRDEGFEVTTAQDGLEAIRWLEGRRPSTCIVLLDLMMPVMDGGTFLKKKQTEPSFARYPVVIITASTNASAFDRTPDVKACLAKPIEVPDLFAALESCA